MTIHVRSAIPADASALSRLAADTFRDTFGRDNSLEDMESYIGDSFTPARQAAEIADAGGAVLLADHRPASGESELVGYAHLVASAPPAAVTGRTPVELKRLYVARAWHGRGVAQALLEASLDTARERGAETVWLGVWERNGRAAAFYVKHGFVRVGEHAFVLGSDVQTDWLLARPVTGS